MSLVEKEPGKNGTVNNANFRKYVDSRVRGNDRGYAERKGRGNKTRKRLSGSFCTSGVHLITIVLWKWH